MLISFFIIVAGKLHAYHICYFRVWIFQVNIWMHKSDALICNTHATDSIEPAALRQWPIIDFKELVSGKSLPLRPKTCTPVLYFLPVGHGRG